MSSSNNDPWVSDTKHCKKCHWYRDGKCGFRGFKKIENHVRKGAPRCKGLTVSDDSGIMKHI